MKIEVVICTKTHCVDSNHPWYYSYLVRKPSDPHFTFDCHDVDELAGILKSKVEGEDKYAPLITDFTGTREQFKRLISKFGRVVSPSVEAHFRPYRLWNDVRYKD